MKAAPTCKLLATPPKAALACLSWGCEPPHWQRPECAPAERGSSLTCESLRETATESSDRCFAGQRRILTLATEVQSAIASPAAVSKSCGVNVSERSTLAAASSVESVAAHDATESSAARPAAIGGNSSQLNASVLVAIKSSAAIAASASGPRTVTTAIGSNRVIPCAIDPYRCGHTVQNL